MIGHGCVETEQASLKGVWKMPFWSSGNYQYNRGLRKSYAEPYAAAGWGVSKTASDPRRRCKQQFDPRMPCEQFAKEPEGGLESLAVTDKAALTLKL